LNNAVIDSNLEITQSLLLAPRIFIFIEVVNALGRNQIAY